MDTLRTLTVLKATPAARRRTRSLWRSVLSGIAVLALLLALFGSLARTHQSRDRYSRLNQAASDLSINVNALAALGWETIVNGNAETDELEEAQALVEEGDAFAATVVQLDDDELGPDVRSGWALFSSSSQNMLRLVYLGKVGAADELEEGTV